MSPSIAAVSRRALPYFAVGLCCVALTALFYEQRKQDPIDPPAILASVDGDGDAAQGSHSQGESARTSTTELVMPDRVELAEEHQDSQDNDLPPDSFGSKTRLEWAKLHIHRKVESLAQDPFFNPKGLQLDNRDAAMLQELVDDVMLSLQPEQERWKLEAHEMHLKNARSGRALDVTDPATLKNYNAQPRSIRNPRDEEIGYATIAGKTYVSRIAWGDDAEYDDLRSGVLTEKQLLAQAVRTMFEEKGKSK